MFSYLMILLFFFMQKTAYDMSISDWSSDVCSSDLYDSFYRAKAMWHDELADVTELSYKNLREVLFKMMVEAGLLTKQRTIEPALLSARVAECFMQRTPSDIRFFPTRVA